MEPANDGSRSIEPSNGDSHEPVLLSSSSSSLSTSSFNSLLNINEFGNEEDVVINNEANSQLIKPTSPLDHETPPAETPVSQMVDESSMSYDPDRIPSSIFSIKATGQTEWSVASNESLFSIHTGNSSFSLGKSGELFSIHVAVPMKVNDEQTAHPFDLTEEEEEEEEEVITKPPQIIMVKEQEEVITKPPQIIMVNKEEVITKPPQIIMVNKEEESNQRISESTHFSEDSVNSSNSFVFPLLTNQSTTMEVPARCSSGKAAPPSPEKATSLPVEKPNWEAETPADKNDGPELEGTEKKTWSSYFPCFSFCSMNWQFRGWRSGKQIEPETKN